MIRVKMMPIAAAAVLCSSLAFAEQPFITKSDQPHPFGTGADQQRLIANVCGTQLAKLGEAGCGCLAERSMTELSEAQRDYLVLAAVQPAAAERTDTAHSAADLRAIAGFLEQAGQACLPPGTVLPPGPTVPPAGVMTPGG